MNKVVVYNVGSVGEGDCVNGEHYFIGAGESLVVNSDVADELVSRFDNLSLSLSLDKESKVYEFSGEFYDAMSGVVDNSNGADLLHGVLCRVLDEVKCLDLGDGSVDVFAEIERDAIKNAGVLDGIAKGGEDKTGGEDDKKNNKKQK